MPPKEAPKKAAPNIVRQPISNSSLLWVPDDAVPGYQERLERCVEWTVQGSAVRHHKKQCTEENIPPVSFTEAFQNKIKKSILHGFLDEESTLSLQDHWEITLPLSIWDSENSGIEETKICFKSANNITDGLIGMIKKAVKKEDRILLKKEMKESPVLRVTNSEMTYFDEGLKEYKHLTTLSLCGNCIDEINCDVLPSGLRILELQANCISSLNNFENLPHHLMYLGLSRNLLSDDGITQLPRSLHVLDLSDNDIYHLEPLLDILMRLPNLSSLMLAGNPCSLCAAYAQTTIYRLQRLRWLDNRQVLRSDRPNGLEPHPDDLRSAYFYFYILRIMSPPCPPKPEKGSTGLFHVQLELPLLDSTRRSFLMFAPYESLIETMPIAEDDIPPSLTPSTSGSKLSKDSQIMAPESTSEETDIFMKLEPKNSKIIRNFTTFESNKVAWNKFMTFQEPAFKIFCPDLKALRDTFHSIITIKLRYTLTLPSKKPDKKQSMMKVIKPTPTEFSVTIATIKCALRNPDWSQNTQYFHWDDTFGTTDAIHWGDGDLSAVQYQTTAVKVMKSKADADPKTEKQLIPDNLTCQFGFGIETLR